MTNYVRVRNGGIVQLWPGLNCGPTINHCTLSWDVNPELGPHGTSVISRFSRGQEQQTDFAALLTNNSPVF